VEAWNTPGVTRLVELALEEDLGRGDITTLAVIPKGLQARARVVAREELVVAGLHLFEQVVKRVDPAVEVTLEVDEGDMTELGVALISLRGSAASILTAERTGLNFLQRLSGIATITRRYVERISGTRSRVTDTRKTLPGYRVLEKYAVRMGGGTNHRFDLGSGVLIKDNHIAVAGGVAKAVRRAREAAPHGMKIEVEVDDLVGLDAALDAEADVILLDNFSLDDIAEAVERVRRQAPAVVIEVSGGVRLDTIEAIASLGVDIISVGALTHSAPAVDIALDLQLDV